MFILPVIRRAFKSYWYHQVPCCQFVFFRPHLVYTPELAFSGVNFQPLSYCGERLHKELLSSGIKFDYIIRICCNNLSLFQYLSYELLYVVTISLSIWTIHFSHTILGAHQWVDFYLSVNTIIPSLWLTLRVIVKLQIFVFIILLSPSADNNLINISLCGVHLLWGLLTQNNIHELTYDDLREHRCIHSNNIFGMCCIINPN